MRRRVAGLRREVAGALDRVARECDTSMPPPLVVMILLPLKEKTAHVAERAGRPAAVGRAERLGRILDQRHAVAFADRRRSGRSRRTGRTGPPRSPPRAGVPRARALVSSSRAGPDRCSRSGRRVDEDRARAEIDDGVGGGDERQRRDEHLVAAVRRRARRAPGGARRCRSTERPRAARPTAAANSRSNASTCGPSGATHPDSRASRTSSRSRRLRSGGER